MIWYYIDESITDGDRRKGPYSIDELMDLVKSETVKPQTLVWHSGMKDWVRWEDTEEAKNNANLFEKGESAEGSALSDEEQIKAALEAILAEHKASKRYAGFFVRAAAYFVDNLILSAFGIVILMVLSAMQLADLNAISEAMNAYIADPTAEDAMSKILEAPGKKLFKIHVEPAYSISTVSGIAKVSWVLSTLRYVASLFTQFTLMFYGIGYLVVMIDPKRRSLHDWIARTYVVHDTSVKIKVRPDDDQEK